MPRYFTALSSVVTLGLALSASAMVTPAALNHDGNQAAIQNANIQRSPAGREYMVYPTKNATYAIMQGKHGLVLVKKTNLGIQHFAINADGIDSVEAANKLLMEPLIAKHGVDNALAQLEEVVKATAGTEAAQAIEPAVASDDNDRGGAKLILVDGTEQPRRRYPPRHPLPQDEGYPMEDGGYAGYPPVGGPPVGVGGGVAVGVGGPQVIIQQVPVPVPVPVGGCVGAPCGRPPCYNCGIPPCAPGMLCGQPVPPPTCGIGFPCNGPTPFYGYGSVNAPPIAVPMGRAPCDRRVYGPYCG